MRPKQWFKNVFLFAALIFSQSFLNVQLCLQALLGFAVFCCLSSSGYILNDIMDIEADKAHPKKCLRPIAAGQISIPSAYTLFVILLAMGFFLAGQISSLLMIVSGLYLITTLSYSFFFKHIVLLDIMFIAMGFLWRVVAGAVAINVTQHFRTAAITSLQPAGLPRPQRTRRDRHTKHAPVVIDHLRVALFRCPKQQVVNVRAPFKKKLAIPLVEFHQDASLSVASCIFGWCTPP